MVRFWLPILVVMSFLVASLPAAAQSEDDVLILFWGDGCPHCEAEREFLASLAEEYPELPVRQYEVWYSDENRALFAETMADLGGEATSVPVTIYRGEVFVGYSQELGDYLRSLVAARYGLEEEPTPSPDSVQLPWLGTIDVEHQPLVVATLLIGFVDGFNPCSLWVLSILLALVLRTGSRSRVFAVGSTFLLVTAALYGLYIAGLYGVLSIVAYSTWVRVAMALVALSFGIVNLRDYFRGQGFTLAIPTSKKPGIYQRARSVAALDRSLPAALFGTVLLAVGVSILETPCTAGYPLLWADLLAEQGVQFQVATALFGLYMLVFLLDEFLVFGVAVVAMRATKLQERQGRLLKLGGGSVMVTLAAVLVAAPHLMESVTGAVAVFLAAGIVSGALALIDRHVPHGDQARTEQRPPTAKRS